MAEVIAHGDGVELRHQQLKLRVEAWGSDSLRVRGTLLGKIDASEDWALLKPTESSVKVEVSSKGASSDQRQDLLQSGTRPRRHRVDALEH